MTTSVEDVLKAEIPEGKFAWVMDLIQYELGRHSTCIVPEKRESFCASFEALYDLSMCGVDSTEDYANTIRKQECASTLSEVRRVVEEMKLENNSDSSILNALSELKLRLAELEAKE